MTPFLAQNIFGSRRWWFFEVWISIFNLGKSWEDLEKIVSLQNKNGKCLVPLLLLFKVWIYILSLGKTWRRIVSFRNKDGLSLGPLLMIFQVWNYILVVGSLVKTLKKIESLRNKDGQRLGPLLGIHQNKQIKSQEKRGGVALWSLIR